MDWDGVGTFALFIASGGVGLGIIALKAYKAKLASKLEWARLERSEEVPEQVAEHIRDLEDQVRNLAARVDFTENLLDSPSDRAHQD